MSHLWSSLISFFLSFPQFLKIATLHGTVYGNRRRFESTILLFYSKETGTSMTRGGPNEENILAQMAYHRIKPRTNKLVFIR